jgi:hypothetical protein
VSAILVGVGIVFLVAGLACTFSIIADAFENELWMGLMCLVFWPYMLWYAVAEYDHEKKWVMVGLWLFGSSVGLALISCGRLAAA